MASVLTCLARAGALCLRALLVVLFLAAPVLALPSGAGQRFLEQPALKGSGIGLVLLVSLQRA